MTSRAELARRACADNLGRDGFCRRAGGTCTREVDGFLWWVGLGAASHRPSGVPEVNAVVGVRWQKLERDLAKLRQEPVRLYLPPTVSTQVGYLMPGRSYQSWKVPAEEDAHGAAEEVCAAIRECGYPFMEKQSSPEAITESLVRGGLTPEPLQLAMRVAMALREMGRYAESKRSVDASLRTLGGRTDMAAENFRSFARAFFDGCDGGRNS